MGQRVDIGVIDYGMGNLRSVEKAFEVLGCSTLRILEPRQLDLVKRLVLPGVGTFGQAVENLKQRGLFEALRTEVRDGKPLLGLCLGLQLLFESSEEFGLNRGLALLAGKVRRLPANVQVPHIGWNEVSQRRADPLFQDLANPSYFYFLHSYFVDPEDSECAVGTAHHGVPFAVVVRSGSIAGAQFHPEKSQQAGLRFLRNFASAGC